MTTEASVPARAGTCTQPKLSKYCRNCSSVTLGGMRAMNSRDVRCGGPPRGSASLGCARGHHTNRLNDMLPSNHGFALKRQSALHIIECTLPHS